MAAAASFAATRDLTRLADALDDLSRHDIERELSTRKPGRRSSKAA
jgi:hypothetical protein